MKSTTLRMAATAIGSAMVFGASATAASAAPATFSSTGPLSISPAAPLVIKIGTTPTPATTVTCTNTPSTLRGSAVNNGAQGSLTGFEFQVLSCVTGTGQGAQVSTARSVYPLLATKSGSDYSLSGNYFWSMMIIAGLASYPSSPAYGGTPGGYSASWLNNVSGPSTLTFNNAAVGRVAPGYPLAGQPITLTGSFSVTNGGSPITLS